MPAKRDALFISWLRLGPVGAAMLTANASAIAGEQHKTPPDSPRVEVPIVEDVLSDGERRYAIDITIKGVKMKAGLDTGSIGLRVLDRHKSPDRNATGKRAERHEFGSGSLLIGPAKYARIAVGSMVASIPLQLVEAVWCDRAMPRCPAEKLPFE